MLYILNIFLNDICIGKLCIDNLGDCEEYGKVVCVFLYEKWVR